MTRSIHSVAASTSLSDQVAALSKGELVRLVHGLLHRHLLLLTPWDLARCRYEEARAASDLAFRAVMSDDQHDKALEVYMAACRALSECTNDRARKKALKAYDTASFQLKQAERERERKWATYKRLDARADRLWKLMEENEA